MDSPEFKHQRFLWLDQVLADPELPASAFKIAYRLAQRFSEKHGGKAWESCETIGRNTGLSETSVIRMVRRLHARGHLRVEWGQRGRGHPHNYWMILKPASAQVFATIKPASVHGKPASTQETSSTTHETPNGVSHGERENAGASAPLGGTPLRSAPGGQKEESKAGGAGSLEGLGALRGMWLRGHPSDASVREGKAVEAAWAAAMGSGATPEAILTGAQKWIKAADAPRYLPKLSDWLNAHSWEQPPPPKPKANGAGGKSYPRRKSSNKKSDNFLKAVGLEEGDDPRTIRPRRAS